MLFEKFDEKKAQSGIGSMLLIKNASGKFSILCPASKIPSVKGDKESIEIDVTTSDTKNQIEGKTTLEKVELEVYNHRDNKRRFEKIEGKPQEFIACDGDLAGERFTGTVTYKVGERTAGEATKATVTITPSAFLGNVDNVKPLLQKTALFDTPVPSVITLDASVKTYELDIAMDPVDATYTATSEAPSIVTAAQTSGKLTITAVAKGSTVVVLKSDKAECASWETTILVIVDEVASSGDA
ncbi:hypothetical protein DWX17_13095 [[Clostridium] innocuum]|jgi:hypothetical protein|uniref:hypothetical protein n=1 Tax=Clostridium innocuum TaxID=1522 RepID=UPI000E49B265|nr:hypothetical protein [[Clostridium] innocuum]RGT66929.1 hypothetical protein DWX17_13095 [[Clostridium] innocuum]